jgi:hypothetical protein
MAASLSWPFIAWRGQKTSCEPAPSRQHAVVAKFIVKNNPKQQALFYCTRRLHSLNAKAQQQKSPGARLARAAWRSFAEYAFLEDSRYTSQLKMCGATESSGRGSFTAVFFVQYTEAIGYRTIHFGTVEGSLSWLVWRSLLFVIFFSNHLLKPLSK